MLDRNTITHRHIAGGLSYDTYRSLIDTLVLQGKTTGENQTDSYLEYTTLNVRRMCRLDRTIRMIPETEEALPRVSLKQYWLLLSEAWCGDAAQIVPVIAKVASLSEMIDLKILLRDENLDIMDQYLTNGGRAIPKLLAVDAGNLSVLWHWGPRPAGAQALMDQYKKNPVGPKSEVLKQIQLWYTKDRGVAIQQELLERLTRV